MFIEVQFKLHEGSFYETINDAANLIQFRFKALILGVEVYKLGHMSICRSRHLTLNHNYVERWFQQDGATCHTARATIDLLKDTFGDRLISRFGPVNWPPRSCDLTPLDYFLWGYVKSLVYADKPQTLDHLEDNIRRVIAGYTATNVGKSHRKLDVQIGLHPSQPWQSYARNHI
ncbi:hypothetical protein TNCV_1764381 [Trichonephila clavipes]|nr:hypothetical protein TNCV_1764381 [Trichonephila clavipes]